MSEPPKPVLVELEYSGPRAPEPLPLARTDPLFRFTMACWLVPLCLGFVDFLLYLIFRNQAFEWIGGAIILLGTAADFIGFICTICFLARRWGKSADRFNEVVGPALGLLFLLGFNYPVAFVLAIIAEPK